jgi:peptidoglycan/LPS O-acetylase OafA/YrhL
MHSREEIWFMKVNGHNLTEVNSRYIFLDFLRGSAAIGVMFYHIFLTSNIWFRGAGMLVDFFFVLSGFVLAGQTSKANLGNRKSYIISRILRLWPPLVPVFVVIILVERIPFLNNHLLDQENYNSILTYAGGFLLLHLLFPSLANLNISLWSLSSEFVVNLIAVRVSPKNFGKFVVIIFGVVATSVGIYINDKFDLNWGQTSYLISLGRALVGFYLGMYCRERFNAKAHNCATKKLLCWSFLFIAAFFLARFTIWAFVLAPFISTGIVINGARLTIPPKQKVFKKVALTLGKLSYGIYIWHGLFYLHGYFAYVIFNYTFLKNLNPILETVIEVVLRCGFVIAISAVSYRFIENPIRLMGGRMFLKPDNNTSK